MPKISVHYGLTLPIPGQQYTNLKADVTFDDIDTEGDVAAQVARCVEVATQVGEVAESALAQQASNLSGLAIEGLGLPKEFAAFKGKVTDLITRIANEVTRQKGVLDGIAGNKPADAGAKGRTAKAGAAKPGAGDGSSAGAGPVAPTA